MSLEAVLLYQNFSNYIIHNMHILCTFFYSVHVWVMIVHLTWSSCIVTVQFTYHLFVHLGFAQITVHHILPSVITFPLPLPHPWLLTMIARLGWTFPYTVQDTCAPPTHHKIKIISRGGKLFFTHDCSI